MKKKRVMDNMFFQWEIIPWIMMFPVILKIINLKIEDEFHAILKIDDVSQSVEKYMRNIIEIMVVVFLIIILWWGIAVFNKSGIRKLFEEKTFLWALFLIAAVAVVVLMFSQDQGIIDNIGEKRQLTYSYYIIKGVVINVFLFPPRNVKKVIFLGGDVGRILLVLSLAVIWYFK